MVVDLLQQFGQSALVRLIDSWLGGIGLVLMALGGDVRGLGSGSRSLLTMLVLEGLSWVDNQVGSHLPMSHTILSLPCILELLS